VLTGAVELTPGESAEVERLCGTAPAAERVGLGDDATPDGIRTGALAGIERWRSRASSPLSDRRTIEAAEIVIRAYEGIFTMAGAAR
jgi:hypothetical protein